MTTASDLERIANLQTEATPASAAALQHLAESTDNKETRKAARRALYLLSQRHIVPPERTMEASQQSASPSVSAPLIAYASVYDGAGNRAIYLSYSGTDGGNPTFVQFLINDETGIRDLGAQKLSRRAMAEMALTLEGQIDQGIVFAEVETDYALHLLAEARAISQRLRTQTPPGTAEWLARSGAPTGDYSRAPVYARLSAEEVQADANVPRDPHELFLLPWFEPWFLDVDQVAPWMERILTSVESPLELSEEIKRERAEGATAEAVNALLTGETRSRYVRRLEETADILLRRGLEMDARQALYHAIELGSDRPANQVPFATRLVERTITVAFAMQMQGEGA